MRSPVFAGRARGTCAAGLMTLRPSSSVFSKSIGSCGDAPVSGAPFVSRLPIAFSWEARSRVCHTSTSMRIRRITMPVTPSIHGASVVAAFHTRSASLASTFGCSCPSSWPNRLRVTPASLGRAPAWKPRCCQRGVAMPLSALTSCVAA